MNSAIKNLLVVMVIASSGCGPLVPNHIQADLNVSGGATLSLGVSDIAQYFQAYCTDKLGSTASQAAVAQCTGSEVSQFLKFFSSLGGSK